MVYKKSFSLILKLSILIIGMIFMIIPNATAQIRVMPLGDAIVVGTGSSPNDVGGFRDDLHMMLNANAMPFDFVGSQNDGVSTDPYHEGYAGATIDVINQDLSYHLQQYRPHMVILYAGTRDVLKDESISTIIDDLTNTINIISSYSDTTEIFVSNLIPNKDPMVNDKINQLNLQIESLVLTQQTLGKNIFLVNQNQAFTSSSWESQYMSDTTSTYPNDIGYQVMANEWFANITNASFYYDLKTYTDDFNDRTDVGIKWNANESYDVIYDELDNTSSQYVWDYMSACFNAIANPTTISFQYSTNNSDTTGIKESGFAVLLDSASIYSNGYVVTMNNNQLRLFEIAQGLIGENYDNTDIGNTMPQQGDQVRLDILRDDQGYHFTAHVNQVAVATVEHITSTSPNRPYFGGVMLRGNLNNNIDEFYITNVVDETPPATITDLNIVHTGPTIAKLQWTATGDDDVSGQLDHYDLRYATFPIDQTNFDQATAVNMIQEPASPQTKDTTYVSGLKPNTTYYFAIKAVDDNNNQSDLSNVVSTTLNDAVYFYDDFERSELGEQWSTDNGIDISNGDLITTSTENAWQSHAILKGPNNPLVAGFQWSKSISGSEIENAGILLKLGSDNPQSNGYMIQWKKLHQQFKLWSVIQGAPTDVLDTGTDQLSGISPGDRFTIYTYSNTSGQHFVLFVNDVYCGVLTDADDIFGTVDPQYGGVLLHGNSSVAVENFFSYSQVSIPANLNYVSGNGLTDTVRQVLNQPLQVEVTDASQEPIYFGNVGFEVTNGEALLSPPAYPDGTIYLEAENGFPIQPMQIEADLDASGGNYITTHTGSGENGTIKLYVYVPSSGNYRFWGRSIAPSGEQNSFFIQVDNQSEFIWDVSNTTNWSWDLLSARNPGETEPEYDPFVTVLSEGIHVITVKQREPETKLDKLILTKNTLFSPSGKEEVDRYPSDFSGIAQTYLILGEQAGTVSVRAWMDALPGQDITFQCQAVADTAFQIQYISGDNQNGAAGSPLSQPFVSRVTDQYGNPVADYPVQFEVTQGNGQMAETQPVLTNGAGDASSTLIMATDVPENKVEARAPALQGSPIEFTANATAGFPTTIQYISGNNQTGDVGTTLPDPLVVQVVDNENNPISGYTVVFEIQSGIGGILSADTVQTDANGEAKTNFTFGTVVGEYQVAAIAEGLQNSPILFSLSADPGPAYQMAEVSGDSTVGVCSYPLNDPFVVQITDQYGNAVPGENVLFTVIEGDGNFEGNGEQLTATTNDSGFASATLVLGPLTGNYNNKVKVEKQGLQGSPIYFVASALPPTASHITIKDGDGQMGTVNQTLDAPFRVQVTNAVGEPAKNHPVIFHVVSGGGIFMGSMDTVRTVSTDDNGIAAATLQCGPAAGNDINVVKATSTVGSTPLIGSPIWFKASAKYPGVKLIEVRGNNQTGLVNTQLPTPLEVKVVDGQDNIVVGQPVEFLLVKGGGKLDSTSDTLVVKKTNTTGKASVWLTLGNSSGVNNHVVQVSATDGFQPLQNSPITFQASAANTNAANLVNLSGNSLEGVVGKAIGEAIQVKVTDEYDQPVSNQEVQFTITAGDGYLNCSPEDTMITLTSNSDGLAQVNWILGTEAGGQNNQLQITAHNGVAELEGSPVTITATAHPDITDPDSSEISASSPVIADGQDKSVITVILRDQYNNPIPKKNVVLTGSGEFVFLEQPQSVTDDSGKTVGYMTSIKAGNKTVYAKDSDDNILLNHEVEITFTASQASKVIIAAGNEQTRNVGTVLKNPLVVLVTDEYDNPIPDYPVTFRAKTGNGYIIESQPVHTDSLGMATSNYVLSDSPGNNVIEADAGELEGSPALFAALGEENPPSQIIYHSGNNQTGIVGEQLSDPLNVQVLDEANNPVKNVNVTYGFSFGNGQVVKPQPVQTDQYGVASSQVILGENVQTNIIMASCEGLMGSPVTFLANAIAGDPVELEIYAGDGQQVNLQSQSQSLTVLVKDQYDNPVPNIPVNFEMISGDATVQTSQPVYSNNRGQASVTIQTGTRSGSARVRASLDENPEVKAVFSCTIIPDSPENLILYSEDHQAVTVGTRTPTPLQALITDQYDNPVPNVQVSFVLSSGDASVVGNKDKYTDHNGIADCFLDIGQTTGPIEVFATSPSLLNALLTYHLNAVENQFPTLANIQDQQLCENDPLDLEISATDPDGDSLIFVVQDLPDGAVLSPVDSMTCHFSWTPDYDQSGVYVVIFSVYDNKGGADRDTVEMEVLNRNREPVITYFYPPRDTSLIPGQELSFDLEASDPDGDSVSIFWHKNGSFVSDSTVYIYRSDSDFTGQDKITGFAADAQDTVYHHWIVTVKTSVELSEYKAEINKEQQNIVIQWRTSSEKNNVGFEVWRSRNRDGTYRPVTDDVILSNPEGRYEFIDDSVQAGMRYFYQLASKNIYGATIMHTPVTAHIPLPNQYQLKQNYPNPFALNLGQRKTTIKFELPQRKRVSIKIFNVLGQNVRSLVQGKQLAPGYHHIQWDGRDESGKIISSGIYYYIFHAGDFEDIKRMILIR